MLYHGDLRHADDLPMPVSSVRYLPCVAAIILQQVYQRLACYCYILNTSPPERYGRPATRGGSARLPRRPGGM
jgi:hypothetical protein